MSRGDAGTYTYEQAHACPFGTFALIAEMKTRHFLLGAGYTIMVSAQTLQKLGRKKCRVRAEMPWNLPDTHFRVLDS